MIASPSPTPRWEPVKTGSTSRFRAIAPVSREVVWLGGFNGQVLRTISGGRSWEDVSPPGAEHLQFRAVSAFDADTALAMTVGLGEDSRVYRTEDGGTTWTEVLRSTEPEGFFNSIRFSDRANGLVLGDQVNGRFEIFRTEDGGRSWTKASEEFMPEGLEGEGAFAASGGCLAVHKNFAWFGTGGAGRARVFRSVDRGKTWAVSDTPQPSREMSGIFGLSFSDESNGFAVGGDHSNPDEPQMTIMKSESGGVTWEAAGESTTVGFRSAIVQLQNRANLLITVGMGGSNFSEDGGLTWEPLGGAFNGAFDAVECAADGSCWASGDNGRVAYLSH